MSKKIAVIIYDNFCNFEFCVLLESFVLVNASIKVFAIEKRLYRSEEGLSVMPDALISECKADDYDAIVLTGCMDEKFEAMHNEDLMQLIRDFDAQKKVIAAISIGPLLLLKAGIMKDRPFMIGIKKADLLEEGFTMEDMKDMLDWDYCCGRFDTMKYFVDGHIVTSVAYGYREWAMETCKMLDLAVSPDIFGL